LAARLFARLGRRAGWLGRQPLIRLLRVWRILGGGKMRQILLRPQPRKNLFINKESFFNVGGGKIFKRWFFAWLSPPPPVVYPKKKFHRRGSRIFPIYPAVSVLGLQLAFGCLEFILSETEGLPPLRACLPLKVVTIAPSL
jgi:hypothetical protein